MGRRNEQYAGGHYDIWGGGEAKRLSGKGKREKSLEGKCQEKAQHDCSRANLSGTKLLSFFHNAFVIGGKRGSADGKEKTRTDGKRKKTTRRRKEKSDWGGFIIGGGFRWKRGTAEDFVLRKQKKIPESERKRGKKTGCNFLHQNVFSSCAGRGRGLGKKNAARQNF